MAASRFSQSTAAVSNHLEEFSVNGNHVEEDGVRSVYSSSSINNNSNARDLSETASSSYAAMTTHKYGILAADCRVLSHLSNAVFRVSSKREGGGLKDNSFHYDLLIRNMLVTLRLDVGVLSLSGNRKCGEMTVFLNSTVAVQLAAMKCSLKLYYALNMKTGCVALVLCLNISVDPPDVIKISPCARMECWIDPFSMAPQKALETIGRTLSQQYERWQPKARYKYSLDPTVEEVKKLCTTCRKYAKSERVLFHYNGHGVPKPTPSGEIWLFNKLQEYSTSSSGSSMRDCILLAACEAHETLPQSAEFPADVFTSCLTTPIKKRDPYIITLYLHN
ncbi:UNVERIFIED_CONTAM: Regulatory-associated protein of TOR 2 [Sesamum angustifolium]|uniref:Regulatory-associated protein of TOR 2 n=1 Tax=Sesamum angustifolium TaxID=2727405 RepID=A0AAW2N352_9LAMI